MTTLVGLIETVDLLELAGERSYVRGVNYAEDGRVALGDVSAQHVEARVRGEVSYRVELSVDRGRLVWSCSCPIGLSGECCKHAVAVALIVSGEVETGGTSDAGAPDADVREYLATLDAGELADIVLEQAERDPRLHDRLTARGGRPSRVRTRRSRVAQAGGCRLPPARPLRGLPQRTRVGPRCVRAARRPRRPGRRRSRRGGRHARRAVSQEVRSGDGLRRRQRRVDHRHLPSGRRPPPPGLRGRQPSGRAVGASPGQARAHRRARHLPPRRRSVRRRAGVRGVGRVPAGRRAEVGGARAGRPPVVGRGIPDS